MKNIFLLLVAFAYAKDTLVFVIEYSRHGARYPSSTNFPWVKESMGLTSAGMRQHYLFGNALRKRYITNLKFLDENYNHEQIALRVSQVTRTIASIQAQLAGMYPNGFGSKINEMQKKRAIPPNDYDYENWKAELKDHSVMYGYKIIPVSSKQTSIDLYLAPEKSCKTIKEMEASNLKAKEKEIEKKRKDFKPLIDKMAKKLSVSGDLTIKKASSLRDVIICGITEGVFGEKEKEFQQLAKETLPIYQYSKYDLYITVNDTDFLASKVMSTPFLNETRNYLMKAVDNADANKLKYVLNVGSDTLMQALLYQLGMNKERIAILFASGIFIELYKNESSQSKDNHEKYYVKVFLNNENDKNALKLTLKEFIALIDKITYKTSEFNYFCHEYKMKPKSKISKKSIVIPVVISSVVMIAVIIMTIALYKSGGKKEESLTDTINEV